ncbi:hypothetical protein O3P69_020268 [Scylla paramamosain]|uniref:Ionotropic glutamate receptor C-terminal domain-containing protein n=1 Tax=Scylla paramamosain TaxID=85552 RepID=A0AAW0TKI6_SCYPA
MGDALNFSPNPLPFEGWEVVLRRLRDREAFIWPVNLPILPDMVEEYDFSFFLERSTLAFTMAKPTLKPSWLSLYYPLQTEVWIFVAASVLILFIILLMIKHNVEGKRYETWLAVKLVIGTLLDEAIPGELPRKTPMRMLLTAWLIFTFIVGTVYRSNLTACLTIPTYPPRPETLVDLLNTGARVTIVDTMDIFVTSFKQSESTTLRTLTERMVYVPSFKEGMTESLTENSAHLYERLYMEVKVEEYFTNNDGSTSLYVTQGTLLDDFSAFLLIRDAPFRSKIDSCLMVFHESGLLTKWKTKVMDEIRHENQERRKTNILQGEEKKKTTDETDVISLTLLHMQGPLVLYLLTATVSFLAFISEISIGAYRHHNLKMSRRPPASK